MWKMILSPFIGLLFIIFVPLVGILSVPYLIYLKIKKAAKKA